MQPPFTADSRFALGVDIGGTNIKLGLVSERGDMLDTAITSTPQRGDAGEIVSATAQAARTLIERAAVPVEGAGLAAAGVVDLDGEIVRRAPNLPALNNAPLRRMMSEALRLPLVMGNDVDLFGLGEQAWGAAQGLQNFIAVAVGTGVGGAIFINGALYRGAIGGAGELGFTIIAPDGPEVLGCRGVVEGVVGRHGFDNLVAQRFPTGEFPSPRRITELAEQGDPRARLVHHALAEALAEAAASWLHILNPEAIVIGGGTLAGAHYFFQEFESLLRARALATHTRDLRILPGQLGYYAGVLGAAALWLDRRQARPYATPL